jgi:hypothetical protein
MAGEMRIVMTGASRFRPTGGSHACASAGMAPATTVSMSHLSRVPPSAHFTIPLFQHSPRRPQAGTADHLRKTKPIRRWANERQLLFEQGVMGERARSRCGENKANSLWRASYGRPPVTPAQAGVQPALESRTCSWATLPAVRCLDSCLRRNDRVVLPGLASSEAMAACCSKQSQFAGGQKSDKPCSYGGLCEEKAGCAAAKTKPICSAGPDDEPSPPTVPHARRRCPRRGSACPLFQYSTIPSFPSPGREGRTRSVQNKANLPAGGEQESGKRVEK